MSGARVRRQSWRGAILPSAREGRVKPIYKMPARLIPGLAIAVVAMATGSAAADNSVTVRRVYYPIVGSTPAELRAQMSAKGPKNAHASLKQGRAWALTTYSYAEYDAKRCRLRMIATQTLPTWENEMDGSPELKAMWAEFSGMIAEHENGHVEFMREAVAAYIARKCRGGIGRVWGAARAKDRAWDKAAKRNSRLEKTK
jgi:predicted secreted Zn-dependent protease